MRTRLLGPVFFIGFALLTSCSRNTDRRNDDAAHRAGHDAYQATQDLKRDANKAARQLRDAGNQFRQGWNQAKHDNPDKHEDRDKPNPDR